MADFLDQIVKSKKKLNRKRKEYFNQLKNTLNKSSYTRYKLFKQQISTEDEISLIAEIKKASPSQGLIREDFDILKIARTYKDHGASALSVLTEEDHFLGKPSYIKKVSDAVELPVLTKDFIIEDGQIYEACANGASAVLLIVALLDVKQLRALMETAARLDLDALVEVHDENELNIALEADAEIIGINNRNLKTFEVDLKVSEALIPHVPTGKVIVAESGIKSNKDVCLLKDLGAHAVLVGETFMRAEDIGAKIDEVMGRI